MVSIISYFHPCLGNDPIWLNMFQLGWHYQAPRPLQGHQEGCSQTVQPNKDTSKDGKCMLYCKMKKTCFLMHKEHNRCPQPQHLSQFFFHEPWRLDLQKPLKKTYTGYVLLGRVWEFEGWYQAADIHKSFLGLCMAEAASGRSSKAHWWLAAYWSPKCSTGRS